MERFGAKLLWLCSLTQLPGRPATSSLAAYKHHARDLNNSMHWSLMAPLLGRADPALLEAARLFADATSVNGKMRNDMLDYYGGSTESVSLFGDFEGRRVTFPVLVLLERDLSKKDRLAVEGHFFGREAALSVVNFIGLLEGYGATEACLEIMWSNVEFALEAIARIEGLCGRESWLRNLTLRWTSYLIRYAQTRVLAGDPERRAE
jgi:geranylgeranyl pyrophosphate synthase